MKKLLIFLLLCSALLVGCKILHSPSVEEAPYEINWVIGDGFYGTVYCDNYELGSSVVIGGYWEFTGGVSNPGYHYKDRLLILDGSAVTIERRTELAK